MTENSVVSYRPVRGFPGYRVGDDGSIWGCRRSGSGFGTFGQWRKIKPLVASRTGHCSVGLCRNSRVERRSVHRLVLEAFVGACPEGMQCCHNDGDARNNRVENLRWDTHLANQQDKKKHGTNLAGTRNPNAKLDEDRVRRIKSLLKLGWNYREIGEHVGIDKTVVGKIKRGVAWSHIQ
jgi:hypothetical protein